jgi:hypothetical protein
MASLKGQINNQIRARGALPSDLSGVQEAKFQEIKLFWQFSGDQKLK